MFITRTMDQGRRQARQLVECASFKQDLSGDEFATTTGAGGRLLEIKIGCIGPGLGGK
jgi:hypothetical protein